jgi:hypothetical protein
MRYVAPDRWKSVILLYLAWGAVVGAAATPMQMISQRQTGRGAIGIMIAVNLLLPLGAIALAVWYPRVRIAFPGGLLAGAAFIIERIAESNPSFWQWTLKYVGLHMHPVSVVAAIGSAILASVTAMIVSPFRRVGLADQHLRCPRCGYLMSGLTSAGCPECGHGTSVVSG